MQAEINSPLLYEGGINSNASPLLAIDNNNNKDKKNSKNNNYKSSLSSQDLISLNKLR